MDYWMGHLFLVGCGGPEITIDEDLRGPEIYEVS